jgi:hypothetical protein
VTQHYGVRPVLRGISLRIELCSLLVGPIAFMLSRNARVPGEICFSIAASLSVLFALICPPRLKYWRLTGQHRLAPTLQDSQAVSIHKMGQP